MSCNIKEYTNIDKEEIIELYESVGWINYINKPEMLINGFENSLLILGAYINHKLVGIIRVVGDGHSIVYIQDLIVHEDFQRQGIGRMLINEILSLYNNVYQIVLITDNSEKTVEFYKSLRFKEGTDNSISAFLIMNI